MHFWSWESSKRYFLNWECRHKIKKVKNGNIKKLKKERKLFQLRMLRQNKKRKKSKHKKTKKTRPSKMEVYHRDIWNIQGSTNCGAFSARHFILNYFLWECILRFCDKKYRILTFCDNKYRAYFNVLRLKVPYCKVSRGGGGGEIVSKSDEALSAQPGTNIAGNPELTEIAAGWEIGGYIRHRRKQE